MGVITGKIVDVKEANNYVELTIAEHLGAFSSTGMVKLVLDKQATLDLHRTVTGVKVKGGSVAGLARTNFRGKTIDISIG